ncbi:hypothetical protein ANCDUO_10507 [Ancylostoma duodenale]|uniref:Uncharacterized protein n=1 Tax=Ancylostoma duodenale TaxID=51022 RepID=A0A0C2GK74_9BILA|nr:hypothetical protein ANCDUO_10507 [Ancylostoma duodenale]
MEPPWLRISKVNSNTSESIVEALLTTIPCCPPPPPVQCCPQPPVCCQPPPPPCCPPPVVCCSQFHPARILQQLSGPSDPHVLPSMSCLPMSKEIACGTQNEEKSW